MIWIPGEGSDRTMRMRGRNNDDAAPTCGQLLQRYRTLAGLTQEGLAEQAGYSADYIGKLERDQRELPAAALDRRNAGYSPDLDRPRKRRVFHLPGWLHAAGGRGRRRKWHCRNRPASGRIPHAGHMDCALHSTSPAARI